MKIILFVSQIILAFFARLILNKKLAILIKTIAVDLALAIIRIKQNSASNTN